MPGSLRSEQRVHPRVAPRAPIGRRGIVFTWKESGSRSNPYPRLSGSRIPRFRRLYTYEPCSLEPQHNAGTVDRETNLGTTRVPMDETQARSGRHLQPTTVWPEVLRRCIYHAGWPGSGGGYRGYIHTSTRITRFIGTSSSVPVSMSLGQSCMRPAREGREPIYKLSTLTSITKRVVHNDARIARGGRDGGEIRARRDGVREECDGDIHSLTRCPLLSFPSRHVINQSEVRVARSWRG